jgi:hypothetical protein
VVRDKVMAVQGRARVSEGMNNHTQVRIEIAEDGMADGDTADAAPSHVN